MKEIKIIDCFHLSSMEAQIWDKSNLTFVQFKRCVAHLNGANMSE